MSENEKNNSRIISDVGQANEIFNKAKQDDEVTDEGMCTLVENLYQDLKKADQITGDENDFHNFAVTISKVLNDNRKAVDIVQAGLKIHPKETDLLADAILYGYDSGLSANCREWYEQLEQIDKTRWTWRAFSFSIDYLLSVWKSGDEKLKDNIVGLVKKYQEYMPDEEDAWSEEYDVYCEMKQKKDGVKALEEAIEKFAFCPRCWMRYADVMLDQGDYEKAKPIIRKMLRNPKTPEKINPSYMYFLDAQCKLNDLYNTEDYENGTVTEEEINVVYRAFRRALKVDGLPESRRKQIMDYISVLETDTGFTF